MLAVQSVLCFVAIVRMDFAAIGGSAASSVTELNVGYCFPQPDALDRIPKNASKGEFI
jgi:hypothetical protein